MNRSSTGKKLPGNFLIMKMESLTSFLNDEAMTSLWISMKFSGGRASNWQVLAQYVSAYGGLLCGCGNGWVVEMTRRSIWLESRGYQSAFLWQMAAGCSSFCRDGCL